MFHVHPDIRRAETLPGRFYTDPAVYRRVRRHVLPRGVHVVPPWEGVPTPFEILDEPLIRTRDAVLSNVCTHRGARLLEGPCAIRFVCPYHGRSFHPDGRLAHAPGFDGALDFPREEDHLARLEVNSLGPLEVVAPLDVPELDEARRLMDVLPWERAEVETDQLYPLDANWALYVENYLEGFHVPFVHPGLRSSLSGYETRLIPGGSVQIGEGSPTLSLGGRQVAAIYIHLFPVTMLNIYPWGLSLNIVEPLGVDRMQVRYRAYVVHPELRDEGPGGDLDTVEQEDQAVVRRVQRGIGARLYQRGRFSPEHEVAVHDFQRRIASYLQPAT
ncbi:MAG: Rieske 2Fe-2S domain-containing protein [Proteobacteria bacterium]|nr:Rieske 2Fe-2S domain-containing protein [Pseudomonadota bacterium]